PDAALALLSDRDQPIATSVRQGLLRESSGNPLALLELPAALSEEQRAGRAQLPDPIPLTSRVQAAFAARIERLPKLTQALLLVAALDDTGEAAAVLRAGERRGGAARRGRWGAGVGGGGRAGGARGCARAG